MVEWMKMSDLTISLAGHTTSMELISIQKPNIMIPIQNHVEQERNAKRMMEYNISQTLEINNPTKLLGTINNMMKNLENIKINKVAFNEFNMYDGRENALKLIEKVNTN